MAETYPAQAEQGALSLLHFRGGRGPAMAPGYPTGFRVGWLLRIEEMDNETL